MIDDILEAGAAGLTYFDTFLGRANDAGAGVDVTPGDLSNRYHEQRGVDIEAMSAAGNSLLTASGDLAACEADQRASRSLLAENWSGEAADAALFMIDGQLARADTDIASLRSAADAVVVAAAAIASTVTDKAATAATFHRLDVDGRTAEQVDVVLAAARLCPGATPEQLMSLAAFHPNSAPGAARADPTALLALSNECTSWLNTVFVPQVRERVSEFLALCTATDTAVRHILATAVSAFEPFSQSDYPTPDRTPVVGECECPRPTVPDDVAQERVGEPAVAPATTAPATTAPATTAPATTVVPQAAPTSDGDLQPARTFVDAVRDVLAAEMRGMADAPAATESECTDAAPGVTAETPSTATESAPPPERAHLEAELDGHGIRFALAADGTISVELTEAGPDGAECATDAVDPTLDQAETDTSASETPAPETPDAETPAPETPDAETLAPETSDAETPAPENPVSETTAPEPVSPPDAADDTSPVCVPEPPAPEAAEPKAVEPDPAPALESTDPAPADVAPPTLAEAGRL